MQLTQNGTGVPYGNRNVPMTYTLTFDDAVDVWLRYWSGEFQHKIAAYYGVNQGRVNEVLKERLHPGSKQVAASKRSA
jgi:hypothetical protein